MSGSVDRWRLSTRFIALYVLAGLQTGHFLEHIVQMWQLQVLHMSAVQARGIASVLDEEPVHFVFNLGVFIGALVLRRHFPRNPWLAVCVPLSAWHAFEHCFLLWSYLHGEKGAGILGQGGVLFGGLPIGERFLHLCYNGAEVLLLVAALLREARIRQLAPVSTPVAVGGRVLRASSVELGNAGRGDARAAVKASARAVRPSRE